MPTPLRQHRDDAGDAVMEGLSTSHPRVPGARWGSGPARSRPDGSCPCAAGPVRLCLTSLRVRGGQGGDGRGCQPAGEGQPGAGFVLPLAPRWSKIPKGAFRLGRRPNLKRRPACADTRVRDEIVLLFCSPPPPPPASKNQRRSSKGFADTSFPPHHLPLPHVGSAATRLAMGR